MSCSVFIDLRSSDFFFSIFVLWLNLLFRRCVWNALLSLFVVYFHVFLGLCIYIQTCMSQTLQILDVSLQVRISLLYCGICWIWHGGWSRLLVKRSVSFNNKTLEPTILGFCGKMVVEKSIPFKWMQPERMMSLWDTHCWDF